MLYMYIASNVKGLPDAVISLNLRNVQMIKTLGIISMILTTQKPAPLCNTLWQGFFHSKRKMHIISQVIAFKHHRGSRKYLHSLNRHTKLLPTKYHKRGDKTSNLVFVQQLCMVITSRSVHTLAAIYHHYSVVCIRM